MASDDIRTGAFLEALRRVVRNGCVVADIGAGTGIMSIAARTMGAGRVFAIEPAAAIALGGQLARGNGVRGIDFIPDFSTKITLPLQADIIVSDLRGVLPLFQRHLPSVIDARERHLAPNGCLIAQSDRIFASLVEVPDVYDARIGAETITDFGFSTAAARKYVTNTWWKSRAKTEQLLTAPVCWAEIDYLTVTSPDVDGTVTARIEREGKVHGIAMWFDCTLLGEIGFSNAPGKPELIYGNAFFPLSRPVDVFAGDNVHIGIRAKLVGDDYVWSWNTTICDSSEPNELRANFKQSTFLGEPLSRRQLEPIGDGHVPVLGIEGEIDRFILNHIDGASTLGSIARDLAKEFPSSFARWEDALTRAGEWSKRYYRER